MPAHTGRPPASVSTLRDLRGHLRRIAPTPSGTARRGSRSRATSASPAGCRARRRPRPACTAALDHRGRPCRLHAAAQPRDERGELRLPEEPPLGREARRDRRTGSIGLDAVDARRSASGQLAAHDVAETAMRPRAVVEVGGGDTARSRGGRRRRRSADEVARRPPRGAPWPPAAAARCRGLRCGRVGARPAREAPEIVGTVRVDARSARPQSRAAPSAIPDADRSRDRARREARRARRHARTSIHACTRSPAACAWRDRVAERIERRRGGSSPNRLIAWHEQGVEAGGGRGRHHPADGLGGVEACATDPERAHLIALPGRLRRDTHRQHGHHDAERNGEENARGPRAL